jgi:hypothetical protein
MNRLRLCVIAFASSCVPTGSLLVTSAQDNATKQPTDPDSGASKGDALKASLFHANVRPVRPGPSFVSIKTPDGFERRVWTDLPGEADEKTVPGLRFLRPLLALVERDTPIEKELPPVIDAIRRNKDGSVDVRFRVVVANQEFAKRGRDAVLAGERPLLASKHLTQDDIAIERWPLLHCVISIRDRWSKEVLGVSQTDNLVASGDNFDFTLRFSAGEFPRVLDLIRSGDLDFLYRYSYANATEYTGKVDLKGVKHALVTAMQKLRSEQMAREDPAPIFQADANEAVRHVVVSVERTTRANHPELLPQLGQPAEFSALFQRLFAADGVIDMDKLKEGPDVATINMVAAYLKPHLEQIRESLGEDKKFVTITNDRDGTSITTTPPVADARVSAPIPVGPIVFTPSIGISKSLGDPVTTTREFIKQVEEATGTTWKKEEDSEKYRPHLIKKYRFQEGADQVLVDETNTTFLAIGKENGYLEDSPVLVTFTTKTANLSALSGTASDLGPYEGVPIGAVIPFFGSKLPKGYRWCDGIAENAENVFPGNADWVPTHLRGAPLPDMREYLIGGAKDENGVGRTYNAGELTVSGATIDGKNFKTPSDAGVGFTSEGYLINTIGGGALKARDDFGGDFPQLWSVATQRAGQTRGWHLVSLDAIQAVRGGTALTGQQMTPAQTISLNTARSNPRHVMCRWIIRVE